MEYDINQIITNSGLDSRFVRVAMTRQGQTFDIISQSVLGSEYLSYLIARANPHLAEYIYFPAGIPIVIPPIPQAKLNTNQRKSPFA
jgi:phage tail protein X